MSVMQSILVHQLFRHYPSVGTTAEGGCCCGWMTAMCVSGSKRDGMCVERVWFCVLSSYVCIFMLFLLTRWAKTGAETSCFAQFSSSTLLTFVGCFVSTCILCNLYISMCYSIYTSLSILYRFIFSSHLFLPVTSNKSQSSSRQNNSCPVYPRI